MKLSSFLYISKGDVSENTLEYTKKRSALSKTPSMLHREPENLTRDWESPEKCSYHKISFIAFIIKINLSLSPMLKLPTVLVPCPH